MRRSNSDNGKQFYVVQFIELPFANVDKYVCVPHSWIVSRTTSGEKGAFAYPNDEDPLRTKDRVKNKEKPNYEWRFYIAAIKYESDTFEDADNWIEKRNDHKPCKMENSGSQPEPILNRKLRSASQPFFSGTKFDKPSVSVKPYKNPRKPLPRISIRLPLQSKLKKNTGTKQVKLDEIANPVSGVINHPRAVSEHLKEKQSILICDNQLIQSAQTGIAAASDDKTSSEHTLPYFIKGDKSVLSDQSASPKLPHKNQPSPAGQIGEQALSLTDIDTGFDEDNHEDDVADHVQSELLMKAIFPGKTPANSPEPVPQYESVNERSTPLVHLKHSLPEQRLQDVPARRSKEADVNPRTQLLQILTTPITVPRPSSTPNQLSQSKYLQLAFWPPTSAAHKNPRLQVTNEGSSTEVTHNHQRPCSRDFINNTSSPPHCVTNPMNPSAQLLRPSVRKKSSPVTENPVAKRICLENVTKNTLTRQEPSTSTARLHLFDNSVVNQAPRLAQKHPEGAFRQPINNARSDFGVNVINLSVSQQRMNTSTAPNFSNLADHSRFLAEQSQDRQYSAMQEYYLQHMARLGNMLWQPYNGQSIDRRAHQPAMMNGEFTLQSKPNSIGQPNQFLPQYNNQYVPLSGDYMQEKLRRGETSLRESIDGAHTNSKPNTQNVDRNFQLSALNLSNQVHPNFEHPKQRQDPPRYQDLSGHVPKSIANSQTTERQGVIERTPALPKTPIQPLLNAQRGYLLQDPRVRVKLNQNPTEHQILDLVVPGNVVDEVEPITINAEVQTAPLPDRLDETPSALLPGIGIVYRNSRTKKLVVDQATEMDQVMDVDHCGDVAAESSDKSAPQVVDSGCQADEYLVEEQGSPHQETDSESEISTRDVILDRSECEDHSRVDTVLENRITIPQNLQMQQRLDTEQEMLNTYGTLFTQMGASFHYTRDLFNHLRNSIIKCAEVYESLLEKIDKFNEIEQLQISTSLPNDETSGASKENISENSNTENITGISSAPKMNHPQRNTFVLPPEYDPNNPKWTRKYQRKEPGLVELIARTNVYVSKKELKNCKRESKDCRTLARMLLTEVFSKSALSVCSLTGGKAKAFNSLNLDVRPGLDEDARMVLLTFVERYGAKRGWKTDDTSAIISSIRTKILEMRTKYGQAGSA